jgi:phenylacetate-CoA ligase
MIAMKALRAGLNYQIKNLAGLPYRSLVARSWDWSPDECWAYQAQAFGRIYAFARSRVPYYQAHPTDYPELPAGELLATLARLPLLSKTSVRAENAAFWATPPLPLTTFHATSGTSGTPLRLAGTLMERALPRVMQDAWIERVGGITRPRLLYLSGFMTPAAGAELYWRDPLTGALYLSIYSLNAEHREAVLELLARERPTLIYGYASAVHQLALLVGDALRETQAERIAIVTSEVLQPDWRATMEATLVRRVLNLYGSQEGCHIVYECAHGRMHINPLGGIVELLDEAGAPVPAGGRGRVVVTGLIRKSMPLVRYVLGDVAESTGYATECPCGLGWPTIGEIDGRQEDLVVTADGRRIGYLCFHATRTLVGLKEAQLAQLDFARFEMRLVEHDGEGVDRTATEAAIRAQLTQRLGYPIALTFRYLPAIPRGANGKFKAVVVESEEVRNAECQGS